MAKRVQSRNIHHRIVQSCQTGQPLQVLQVRPDSGAHFVFLPASQISNSISIEHLEKPLRIKPSLYCFLGFNILLFWVFCFFLQLVSGFFDDVDKRLQFNGVPQILAKLDKCCSVNNFDADGCIELTKVGSR